MILKILRIFKAMETLYFSNPNQFSVTENVQSSQNTKKQPRGDKWDANEDVALMSAYCIVREDEICGKNKKKIIIVGTSE